ncbi:HNH endonuclease family protein [Amycolatopsis arida]|uniref:HNH endonuclease family protein n=1 Tax=Amycolatopsis arida TaxID=587909 RepID=UPI0010E71B7B|nr:HNH endonuclease family protein [Amycolatopsis arida]TDX84943.1 uncharacterized protein DUF1524 [Amycolatopsis arida]
MPYTDEFDWVLTNRAENGEITAASLGPNRAYVVRDLYRRGHTITRISTLLSTGLHQVKADLAKQGVKAPARRSRTRNRTTRAAAAAAALTVITMLASGCQYLDQVAAGQTGPAAEEVDVAAAQRQLDQLEVRPEDTGYHYDRDDWPHWSYLGDGCDVRDQVLQQQGHDVQVGPDCTITGRWTSPYDVVTVTDPGELDIDHIVALSEVADSGVRGWSEADRERYANDSRHLVAVTATSNRQKSDQDPAEWLPSNTAYRCEYAARWVAAKYEYRLAVDLSERQALTGLLRRCGR